MTTWAQWAESEIEMIRTHYAQLGATRIAGLLGRSVKSVNQKACRLGVSRNRKATTIYGKEMDANIMRMQIMRLYNAMAPGERRIWRAFILTTTGDLWHHHRRVMEAVERKEQRT